MRSIRTVVGMAAIAFMAATATTTFVPAPANAATVEGKACKKAGTTQGEGQADRTNGQRQDGNQCQYRHILHDISQRGAAEEEQRGGTAVGKIANRDV